MIMQGLLNKGRCRQRMEYYVANKVYYRKSKHNSILHLLWIKQ